MKRRANGEGHVRKLPDGRWQAIATVGIRDGKPIRRKRTCGSHKEARDAIAELIEKYRSGGSSLSPTVGEFVASWLRNEVAPNRARNTAANYRQQCRKHLVPLLGSLRMTELSPLAIQNAFASLREKKVPTGAQVYVHQILKVLCNRAIKLLIIDRNPMDAVERPRHTKKDIHPFTVDEVRLILDAATLSPFRSMIHLGFSTGMRIGEIFGLRWEDVDFNDSSLTVNQQLIYGAGGPLHFAKPKTKAGHRTISLSPPCIDSLNDHRKVCVADGLAGCPLVFSTAKGNPVRPTTWWRDVWVPLLDRAKVGRRGFHHVRHTYATMMLGDGVPINVVSGILGHANAAVTLSQYTHFMPKDQGKAIASVSRLIG